VKTIKILTKKEVEKVMDKKIKTKFDILEKMINKLYLKINDLE